jgi:hypothetical protein
MFNKIRKIFLRFFAVLCRAFWRAFAALREFCSLFLLVSLRLCVSNCVSNNAEDQELRLDMRRQAPDMIARNYPMAAVGRQSPKGKGLIGR